MSSSGSILAAQIVGLAATAFTAGMTFTCSYLVIPPILLASSTANMVVQWRHMFLRGKATGPPLALVACGALAYVAYQTSDPFLRKLYVAAAISPVAIMPFTVLMIAPVNSILLERAAASDAKKEIVEKVGQGTKELVIRWANLNYARSLFPVLGTVLAGWGISLSRA